LLAKGNAINLVAICSLFKELSAMMRKIRWAILILGILVLIAIMVQNSHPVLLKLFFFETQLPTSTLLLATSVLSFLIGALTTGRMMWHRDAPPHQTHQPQNAPAATPFK
jgi:uncharacterized integral membrane protein